MFKDFYFDKQKAVEGICSFLKNEHKKANRSTAIVGISGGVDSSVVATLCQKAGLKTRLIFIPYGDFSLQNSVKKNFNNFITVDITESVNRDIDLIEKSFSTQLNKIQKGNIMARRRMEILYNRAWEDGLVLGTENLSEYYLGYFTLYGDQASDLNPIGSFWKTQVIEIAKYLGLHIEEPSAGLYDGQTDEKELGFSYEDVDPVLYLYCYKKLSLEKIIKDYGFKVDLVNNAIEKIDATEYKRRKVPQYKHNLKI